MKQRQRLGISDYSSLLVPIDNFSPAIVPFKAFPLKSMRL
jgi:hypothetical protein